LENYNGRIFGTIVGGGSYAQYCAVKKNNLLEFPDSLSLEECLAIPEVWFTAFQLLTKVAGIEKGDWVFVPASASGVGLAAIQ